MAKYDDASWHSGGNFPSDLDDDNAYTHIGMFLGWAIDNELEGSLLREEFADLLQQYRAREITGAEFLHACCDNKLTDDDLNEEGNSFAEEYYESDRYYDDYAEVFERHPTLYHVEDNKENYGLISKRIGVRFEEWKRSRG